MNHTSEKQIEQLTAEIDRLRIVLTELRREKNDIEAAMKDAQRQSQEAVDEADRFRSDKYEAEELSRSMARTLQCLSGVDFFAWNVEQKSPGRGVFSIEFDGKLAAFTVQHVNDQATTPRLTKIAQCVATELMLMYELKGGKSSANLVKMLEESHVKANKEILQLREQKEYDAKTHELLAAERDNHMRSAAEWQGQCKRMSEVMRALRHVIEVVADGKHPEQWFAMTLAEILKSRPGNTSATEPVNAGGAWPDTSEFTDPVSPLKSTTKTARYLEPALEELPAPEPEIAITEKLSSIHEASEVIQSLLIEMHPGKPSDWWRNSIPENSPVGRALRWLQSHVNSGNINKVRAVFKYAFDDADDAPLTLKADSGATPPPLFGEVDPVDEVLAAHIGDVLTEMNREPPTNVGLGCPNCERRVSSYTTNRETGVSFCEHCQEKPPSPEQLADEARQYQQAAKLWPNGPKG